MELHIHAFMHVCVNTQLIETRVVFIFFLSLSIKFHSVSALCLKLEIQQWTWWNLQSSSQPANFIHNFNVTIEISALTQARCKDKIKQKVLTYTEKSGNVSVRKKHLVLARWEMEECCKQREHPECQLWGRKIFTEQKVSQCDWDTGNADGVMPDRGSFMQNLWI